MPATLFALAKADYSQLVKLYPDQVRLATEKAVYPVPGQLREQHARPSCLSYYRISTSAQHSKTQQSTAQYRIA